MMDRPTKGPVDPNDGEPAPEGRGDQVRDDAWADALRALREVARKREEEAAAAAREPRHEPGFRAPRPPGQSPDRREGEPPVEDTLEALQALARRYTPPSAHDPPPAETHPSDAAPDLPPEPGYSGYEPPPLDEFEEPAPGARLLTRRTRFASLALILVSAAVLAVLLVGALSLSRQLFQGSEMRAERARPTAPEAPPAAPAPAPAHPSPGNEAAAGGTSTVVAVASQLADGTLDLRAVEKAMNDCDDEAARNPDALYFLIVPAISPIKDYSQWAPLSVGDIGTSVILLRSKDALDGLRSGSLAIYPGQYRFSIIDTSTEATHNWGPAAGVAKFVKPDAATITGFRVRFSFADFVGDTPSNFRFPRDKGVCYWVSALLRG